MLLWMKFHILAAAIAAATLTQVGASPLRVAVVTSSRQELPSAPNVRFGHALADSPVAKLWIPHQPVTNRPALRGPCGRRIKQKAIEISNTLRHALGLPTIETTPLKPGDHAHGGMVHIMPFVGTPPMFVNGLTEHNMKVTQGPAVLYKSFGHPHRFHHHKLHNWGNTFWMRLHNALMALGPWEGRAVAFVLGCGIGVLLRMFWVLTVVTYRSIRGERDDEYTQITVIEEYVDAEDIAVPPPTYTTTDEKDQIKVKDNTDAAGN